MDSKKIHADFQFVANRVSSFILETKDVDTSINSAKLDFDFDYNIKKVEKNENNYVGVIEFIVEVKAKIKNAILLKINLKMEGIFIGNPNVLKEETFTSMLELNGVATLSHLGRAYIASTTSISGINPPIRLPMVNFNKLRELKKKTD